MLNNVSKMVEDNFSDCGCCYFCFSSTGQFLLFSSSQTLKKKIFVWGLGGQVKKEMSLFNMNFVVCLCIIKYFHWVQTAISRRDSAALFALVPKVFKISQNKKSCISFSTQSKRTKKLNFRSIVLSLYPCYLQHLRRE